MKTSELSRWPCILSVSVMWYRKPFKNLSWLKVLWNTTKIDSHCFVFSIRFRQILQRNSSRMKFTAFSKLKKYLIKLGQPSSPRPQISRKRSWPYRLTHCLTKLASSISPCRTYSPIGFLCDKLHVVFLLIRDLINSSRKKNCRLDEQPAKCSCKMPNTLYRSCWLFQYNKGRRKIYVFFPKEANFLRTLHVAEQWCVREPKFVVI